MVWDFLTVAYPWTKAFHVISVIAWMAGLFYLPRLFVYHSEQADPGSALSETFKVMEHKLLKYIINPASIATWFFGISLVMTPGVIDWSTDFWAYAKAVLVVAMTWYYHLLARRTKDFAMDRNRHGGRYYRLMNEVPTVLMIGIVIMVIVKPF